MPIKKIPDNEEVERNALLDTIETSPAERRRKQSVQSATSMMSVIESNCVIMADIAYSKENIDSKMNDNDEDEESTWRRFMKKIVLFFDLDLLKNSIYLNVIIGLSFYYVAEMNFKLMTPFFLSSIGMTKREVAFCLSLTAFTDIVARIILPTIFDKHGFQKRSLFWIASFLVGIGRSILVEQSKGTSLMVTLVVIGFLRGATLVNMNLTISENCSLEKLPAAFGIFMVTKGIFIAAVGPLVGFIRDYSNSYKICIHAMTGMVMITFVTWGIEYFWNALYSKKHIVDGSPKK